MCYFVPNFLILVQPTSKVVFNALKSVTIPVLISYILLSDDVSTACPLSGEEGETPTTSSRRGPTLPVWAGELKFGI